MTWAVPDWWTVTLLALAAFRSFQLLAADTILDRPREWLERKMPRGEEFITCSYCAGGWISVGWWLAWTLSARWATIVAVPFAISGVVALIALHADAGAD
jgi:hypothetical protein